MPKKSAPSIIELSPLVQQIVSLVGRRADDPAVIDFVTKTLGQKVPATKGDLPGLKYVSAKKAGIEFGFDHDIKNEKHPLIAKTKRSFVPYLSIVWLTDKFREPFPFGVTFGMDPDEVTKSVGVAPVERGEKQFKHLNWVRDLDPTRDVILDFDAKTRAVCVRQARELSARCGVPALPVVGVFVAWAAQRGLLDPARAGAHAALLEEVRAGKRKGSELLDAAWPRGLWDVHLIDKPGLRRFAYQWFHRLGDAYIIYDLIAVFGSREGPTGHDEPVIDDDTAAVVKKATPKLDAVFAAWL